MELSVCVGDMFGRDQFCVVENDRDDTKVEGNSGAACIDSAEAQRVAEVEACVFKLKARAAQRSASHGVDWWSRSVCDRGLREEQ
jgi:hypothetical protein